jgi:hypothetical protein
MSAASIGIGSVQQQATLPTWLAKCSDHRNSWHAAKKDRRTTASTWVELSAIRIAEIASVPGVAARHELLETRGVTEAVKRVRL